jgi:hypothetical protein
MITEITKWFSRLNILKKLGWSLKVVWWWLYLKRVTIQDLYCIHTVEQLEGYKINFIVDNGNKLYKNHAEGSFKFRFNEIVASQSHSKAK